MDSPLYSVIIPVFNGEDTLRELAERLLKFFWDLGKSCALIFIDDGSQDNSWRVLTEIKKSFPDVVTVIR
ncbi:MAG: glycosyltransferase, partial [Bacteroidales bacterium]|nr:glycosyltransferase [Bacteroidales bacterium]